MRCVAVRCPDEAKPGGQLCPAHQKRLNRGGGLPTADEMAKGDLSGHGQFGIVDIDGLGVLCHECGARFAGLGTHVSKAHYIDANEYETRHGVRPKNAPPRSDGLPRRRAHPCKRCKSPVTTHGKLCAECKVEWLREQEERANRPKPHRRPRWRPLTEAERAELADADPDELSDIVRRLQLDRVGINAIAAELGRDVQQMRREYPRGGQHD